MEGGEQIDNPGVECDICGRWFVSKRAVATHRRRAHNIHDWGFDKVVGTQCQVCDYEFWSEARLRRHLRDCVACGLRARLGQWEVPTQDELEAAHRRTKERAEVLKKRGEHREKTRLPPLSLPRAMSLLGRRQASYTS